MALEKVSRITTTVNKGAHPGLIDALKKAGINNLHVAAGRASVLQERTGPFSAFSSGRGMADDPVDIISFLVDRQREGDFLSLIAEEANLHIPGMGSVYSEDMELLDAHQMCSTNKPQPSYREKPQNLHSELTGITCIVQRGAGDAISRVVLESGACVPTITYGLGTGVRDKLGLLRITIPADKEVLTLVMSSYDVEAVLELMIEAGQLDQPGRGFIYVFSVNQGIINTRITSGSTGAAASMEQIISALDGLKGGMEWRRRGADRATGKDRFFLRGLSDLTLICNEGRGSDLVQAAMDVGASGATISKTAFAAANPAEGGVSPAREVCNMIVARDQLDDIVKAVEKAGVNDDKTHGMVMTAPVPRAFTYIAKS